MPVEAFVFRRDDRVSEMRGGGVSGDSTAKLIAAPGEDLAIAIHQSNGAARATVKKSIRFGKL